MSTGIRFTTLPDATPPSHQVPASASASHKPVPPQPPTTITALFNPMLGYISGAYTAQVSRDLSLSSRFEFNVYSFESDWTMGAEWWLRSPPEGEDVNSSSPMQDVHGVLKARASTSNVCHAYSIHLLDIDLYPEHIASLGGTAEEHVNWIGGCGRPLSQI